MLSSWPWPPVLGRLRHERSRCPPAPSATAVADATHPAARSSNSSWRPLPRSNEFIDTLKVRLRDARLRKRLCRRRHAWRSVVCPRTGTLGQRGAKTLEFCRGKPGTGIDEEDVGRAESTGCVNSGRRWHRRIPSQVRPISRGHSCLWPMIGVRPCTWRHDMSSSLPSDGTAALSVLTIGLRVDHSLERRGAQIQPRPLPETGPSRSTAS